MNESNSYAEDNARPAAPQLRETIGEVLPNGDILDLINPPSGLTLIRYRPGEGVEIAPKIECNGLRYCPPKIAPGILDRMPLPQGIREYGTDERLFNNIRDVFCELGGMAKDCAAALTCCSRATFIAEYLPYFPTICLVAMTISQAFVSFQLLWVLCRRGLLVAQLKPALPFFLRPTAIVTNPMLSIKDRNFWHASSYPGVGVCGPRGTLSELACPKIVMLRPGDPPDVWGENSLLVPLPAKAPLPLSSNELAYLAAEYQPQLELYRLRRLAGEIAECTPKQLPDCDLASVLAPCIPADNSEILDTFLPLLESCREEARERRSRDDRVVAVEVLWIPGHQEGNLRSGKIAEKVNALLGQRGEFRKYNAYNIGWLLKGLGLRTKRGVLTFSAETRQRLHELADEHGLELPPVEGCPLCAKQLKIK